MKKILLCCCAMILVMWVAINPAFAADSNSPALAADINACTSEGFHPDPEDCTKFFRCVDFDNGKLTKFNFDCGPGTVYDPALITCNHPWGVDPNSKCYKPIESN